MIEMKIWKDPGLFLNSQVVLVLGVINKMCQKVHHRLRHLNGLDTTMQQ